MSNNSITTARFIGNSKRFLILGDVWQYDYGQTLKIEGLDLPEAYEVHFSNTDESGSTKTQIGTADGVTIPDEYLTSGEPVYVFIYLHDGETDGETEYKVKLPVRKRPKPSDVEPTPQEQSTITQTIAALNTAVDLAQSYAVSGTGTREGEDTDNARHYSELAAQSAEAAGYAFFEIDDEDGEMYVTVANNLDSDLTFEINENTGNLEVVVR
jgi:hypothetical protein